MVETVLKKNKMLRKIDRQIYYLQGEKEAVRMQELRDKWEYDRQMEIRQCKKVARAVGRKQGEAIGRKQGEAVGRKQGEEIGRKQGEECEKISIAKKMLQMKMSAELIMTITGLSNDDLAMINV